MITNFYDTKARLLFQFLNLCQNGFSWNDQTLIQATIDLNIEKKYLPLIFKNLSEITSFFVNYQNQSFKGIKFTSQSSISKNIKDLIMIRLSLDKNYKQSIRALIRFIKKGNNRFGLSLIYKISSTIWYKNADLSTDFNFYSKRMILSHIYLKTLLFYLDDNSENHISTSNYLDQKIFNIVKFSRKKHEILSKLKEENIFNMLKQNIRKLPFIRLIPK